MGAAGATAGTGAWDRAGTGTASGAGDESWAGTGAVSRTLAGDGARTESETRAGVGLTGAGAGEVRVGAKTGLCTDPNTGIGAGAARTDAGGDSNVSLPTASKGVRELDV